MPNSTEISRLAAAAWRAASRANQAAHADEAIHASQINECARALHYRVTGTPPTDIVAPRMAIKAHWGTALHQFYLPYLAQAWTERDDVTEADVEPDLVINKRDGSPFLIARPDVGIGFTDGSIGIMELKTTGKAGVDAALAGEPKRSHLDQCRLACLIAEHLTGQPVTGYWIYYLDRADPERHWAIIERPWNATEIDRAQALIDHAVALASDIAAAPRWFGRATSEAAAPYSPCLSCQWQSGCLGKDATDPVRAEAAAELVDAAGRASDQIRDAQEVMTDFLRHRVRIEDARATKTKLTDLIDHLGLEPGEYEIDGHKRRLVWREGHDRTDAAACVRMLEALGKSVPTMRTSGFYQIRS